MTKKADDHQFACYNAIQEIGQPATIKMIAKRLGLTNRESEIRKSLNDLCRRKALRKSQLRGVWHYPYLIVLKVVQFGVSSSIDRARPVWDESATAEHGTKSQCDEPQRDRICDVQGVLNG